MSMALNRQLVKVIKGSSSKPRVTELRQATVTAVSAGPPLTCTLSMGGQSIPGIAVITTYIPKVLDVVFVLQQVDDLMVIGTVGGVAATAQTFPDPPTGVVATAGVASAVVSWTAPVYAGTSNITDYIITPYENGNAQTPIPVLSTNTTYTVPSLNNGQSYTFAVAAVNSAGTGSQSAHSVAVTPTGGGGSGPLVVQISPDNAAAELSGAGPNPAVWTLNYPAATTVGNLLMFIGWVFGDATAGTWSVPSGWTACTVFSDGYGITWLYAFLEKAPSVASTTNLTFTFSEGYSMYGAGQLVEFGGPLNGATVTVDGYAATYASGTGLTTATPSALTSLSGGSDLVIHSVAVGTSAPSSLTAAGGAGLTAIGIWGGVYGSYGFSLCEIVTGTPIGTVPSETLSFTCANAAQVGVGSIAFTYVGGTYVPPAGTVPSAITQAPTVTSGVNEVTVAWVPPPSNGGQPITSYVVTPLVNNVQQTPFVTGNTALSYNVTGLANNITYTFTVAATNALGTGQSSPQSLPIQPLGSSGNSVPGTPTGVTATASTSGSAQATVNWTAPSNGGSAITNYFVVPFINGAQQTPISTGSTSTSYTVTGLNLNTAYTFAVYAVNAIGQSNTSVQSTVVTPTNSGSAPVPMMAAYASYKLLPNADWEFATMSSETGAAFVAAQGIWVAEPSTQYHMTVASSVGNIAIVNTKGLQLTLSSASLGANVNTESAAMSANGGGVANPGLAVPIPFYREVGIYFGYQGDGYYHNWPASWMLGVNADAEIFAEVDWPEVNGNQSNGQAYGNLHYDGPNNNGFGASAVKAGVLSPGLHKFGVLVTQTGCTFYLDGALAPIYTTSGSGNNPCPWPNTSNGGSTSIPATSAFYLLHSLDNGPYGGGTLVGDTYTIAYDRVFVPA